MTDIAIKIEHLNYVYSPGTAYEKHALKDICLEIPHGEFVGIIGHTGSGKSTLIQHLNGLVKATDGALYYNGENIYQNGYDMRALRNQVGLVFQYPEYQLFEIDVLTDVCFGPKNQGLSKEECEKRALEALKLVGLKEKYYKSSPFELSGGQKRRVAIAGVLAMRPKVLVLDEPTAGLDPKQRIAVRNFISETASDRTVLWATHIVPDIEGIAREVIILKQGEVTDIAAPEKLIQKMSGKVWRVRVEHNAAEEFRKKYRICSTVPDADGLMLRLLSEGQPCEGAVPLVPTLEDYYLYIFGDIL